MNWLAHVFLSELDTEVRLGNLLADVVKGRDQAGMSETTPRRLSRRLEARVGKRFELERGVSGLRGRFDAQAGDLDEFFPHLQAHVAKGIQVEAGRAGEQGC